MCFVLQYKSKTHIESLNGDVMIGSIKQFGKIFSFSLLGTPHSSTCVAFFFFFFFFFFRFHLFGLRTAQIKSTGPS